MRQKALSDAYGPREILVDCSNLRTFFAQVRSPDQSGDGELGVAYEFVQRHIGNLLGELEARLAAIQSTTSALDDSLPPAGNEAGAQTREDDERFVRDLVPELNYDAPGRVDPFEEPKILVANYPQLEERRARLRGATLQVMCFKSTEPDNLFNTKPGIINEFGYLKWRLVPKSPEQESVLPSLFFQINTGKETLRSKAALVDEDRVLPPLTYDAPEPVSSKAPASSSRVSLDGPRAEDGGEEIAEAVAVSEKSVGSSVLDSENLVEQALDLDTTSVSPLVVREPPSLRSRSSLVAPTQGNVNNPAGDDVDALLQSELRSAGQQSIRAASRSSNRSNRPRDVEAEERLDGENGAVEVREKPPAEDEDDEDEELEGDADSDSDYRGDSDLESEGEHSVLDGSNVDAEESFAKDLGTSEESDSSSIRGSLSSEKLSRTAESLIYTDSGAIEQVDVEMEDHCQEVVGSRDSPLSLVITAKNYKDANRDRPMGCSQISRRGNVRGCQEGQYVAVANEFLKEHIDPAFFATFEPLAFHLCVVEHNCDEQERLRVRRLLPISIFGHNCCAMARDGTLKDMLSSRQLLGPFLYSLKKCDIPLEQHLTIEIKHTQRAEEQGILAVLKAQEPGRRKDLFRADCWDLSEAGVLVLCIAGKNKILRSRYAQETKKVCWDREPQLQPWEAVREHFTMAGFFKWVEEHKDQSQGLAILRENVWKSIVFDSLAPDIQDKIGPKTAFLSGAKSLQGTLRNMTDLLARIKVSVESVLMSSADSRATQVPLDGVSDWTTLYCVAAGWAEEIDATNKSKQNFHARFGNFVGQSLEYFVDGDVSVFSGSRRPTAQTKKDSPFKFNVVGWRIQVVRPLLGQSCMLEVRREDNRVKYLPEAPIRFDKPGFDSPEAR